MVYSQLAKSGRATKAARAGIHLEGGVNGDPANQAALRAMPSQKARLSRFLQRIY